MRREVLVLGVLIVVFIAVIFRLFYWQVIKRDLLAEAASDQYYFTLTIHPARGEILATDGQSLVTNKTAYLVYAEPQKITNQKMFSEKIGEILSIDTAVITERISQKDIVWALLAHKVEEDKYQKLKDLAIEGVGFEKESKRFYPEASSAAHLLGFVGSDERGEDKGYFGIEGFYDLALKGKPGNLLQEKDAHGLPILLGNRKRISAEDGQDVELYLDRTVQSILETKLEAGITKYGAKEGLVIVMDPKTGGIVGLASFPSYDPREFTTFPETLFPNPIVSATYEPGSTFKALIMSAALNEKVVDPNTTFIEEGPVQIGEYAIKTWNDQYHGQLTMTQVLEKSSNPGMVFVAKRLGRERMIEYIKRFGFGEKTGIDLQEEASAELRSIGEWREIDTATASFGQGIAVTPIQMVRAVAALANEGNLMEPHVVKKIITDKGKVVEIKPKKVGQVVKPTTAKLITDMMVAAVDSGDAKWAKPKGYRIAGKTGTAQIAVAGHYDEKKTIASFVGFAPADDPKFVMLVALREPSSSPWGSETAAPLFFAISKELFTYYSISPR